MTVTLPTPPPITDELERLLRRLRLPYVRRAAPEVIATATAQRWEHAEVLRALLAEEAAGRDQATISTRRRSSGLPAGKTFDAWEPAASAIPPQTQQALRTLEWVDRAEVLVACGPSGPHEDWTGETGRIDADLIRRHVSERTFKRLEYFVCGSDPMMDAIEKLLLEIGVPANRLNTERFNFV